MQSRSTSLATTTTRVSQGNPRKNTVALSSGFDPTTSTRRIRRSSMCATLNGNDNDEPGTFNDFLPAKARIKCRKCKRGHCIHKNSAKTRKSVCKTARSYQDRPRSVSPMGSMRRLRQLSRRRRKSPIVPRMTHMRVVETNSSPPPLPPTYNASENNLSLSMHCEQTRRKHCLGMTQG